MKKLITFIASILSILSCGVNAGNVLPPNYPAFADSCNAGVFLTEEDFVHGVLSYKVNLNEKGNKVNIVFPADLSFKVEIATPDTTYKFTPGSIYGYADCGKVYRYFRGGKELNAQRDFYKVEEIGAGLILYSSELVSGNETFYSTSLTAPIHRLTLQNLQKDYGDRPEFIAAAKQLKKKPDGLSTRDREGFAVMKLRRF